MSIVSLVLVSTTYANSLSTAKHNLCRVDYSNASTNASKLQAVLNATVHLIGGISKFSHISYFIRNSLHWLPIHQHIQFKISSLMRNSPTGSGPQYLKADCTPVSSISSHSTLQSSALGHLVVPQTWTYMAQYRGFAIVGPSNRNKLPETFFQNSDFVAQMLLDQSVKWSRKIIWLGNEISV